MKRAMDSTLETEGSAKRTKFEPNPRSTFLCTTVKNGTLLELIPFDLDPTLNRYWTSNRRIQATPILRKNYEDYVQFGEKGSKLGELYRPTAIAVDPISGNLFIADNADGGRIQIFSEDGQSPIGVLLDSSQVQSPLALTFNPQGDLFVVEPRSIKIFNRVGPATVQLEREISQLCESTVTSIHENELIYVTDSSAHKAFIFDPSTGDILKSINADYAIGIAVDIPTGNIFIGARGQIMIFDSSYKLIKKIGQDETEDPPIEPWGIFIDRNGDFAINDGDYRRLNIFSKEGKLLLIKEFPHAGDISQPVLNKNGDIFFVDSLMGKILMFKGCD